MITQQRLKELFRYDCGNLYRYKCLNHLHINKPCGSKHHSGYFHVGIDRKIYTLHRMIFLFHNGFLPKEIDHINGNKGDNRIANLRGCNRSENMTNSRVASNNTSGVKGVGWHKAAGKWQARVYINKVRQTLGMYDNLLDAACVIYSARNKHHGEFANYGRY